MHPTGSDEGSILSLRFKQQTKSVHERRDFAEDNLREPGEILKLW
jgi:hypothetical protein